jgi:hypothetical protein
LFFSSRAANIPTLAIAVVSVPFVPSLFLLFLLLHLIWKWTQGCAEKISRTEREGRRERDYARASGLKCMKKTAWQGDEDLGFGGRFWTLLLLRLAQPR